MFVYMYPCSLVVYIDCSVVMYNRCCPRRYKIRGGLINTESWRLETSYTLAHIGRFGRGGERGHYPQVFLLTCPLLQQRLSCASPERLGFLTCYRAWLRVSGSGLGLAHPGLDLIMP